MKLRQMLVATAAVLSSCAMLTVGLAPAANAATRLSTPAPVVLQDEVGGIMQVSTAARPKGATGYQLQRLSGTKWTDVIACASVCIVGLAKSGTQSWRLIAYGNNGATSAPSEVFSSLPQLSSGSGDIINLYLNKYNLASMTVGALKFDASQAGACGVDKAVQSGLNSLEKKSLDAAAAQGFADPVSDVGAAAFQFEKLVRSAFGSNCDNIKAYDKLLLTQGAKVFSTGQSQQIVVSSQALASWVPSCSMFLGDGSTKNVQNTVVTSRNSCVSFARNLWISA